MTPLLPPHTVAYLTKMVLHQLTIKRLKSRVKCVYNAAMRKFLSNSVNYDTMAEWSKAVVLSTLVFLLEQSGEIR